MNPDLRADDPDAMAAMVDMLIERGCPSFPSGWHAHQIAAEWGVVLNSHKGRTSVWNLARVILQRLPKVDA